MGICWYCYWGWAEPVAEIYKKVSTKCSYNALHFGPSHVVWEDENFDDRNIRHCLEYLEEEDWSKDYSLSEIEAVKWSLEELLKIPEEDRCIEPEDYDEKNPKDYPPNCKVERI